MDRRKFLAKTLTLGAAAVLPLPILASATEKKTSNNSLNVNCGRMMANVNLRQYYH